MKIPSKPMGGRLPGWGLGLLLGLCCAGEARAAFISLEFASGPSFQQIASPFHLEESFNLARIGSGHGVVDLPTGVMKGQIASAGQPALGTFDMAETIGDTFRIRLPPGVSSQLIPISLTANGTGVLPAPDIRGDAVTGMVGINLFVGSVGQDPHSMSFTTNPGLGAIHVPPGELIPISLVSRENLLAQSGAPYAVDVSFRLTGVGGAAFDFLSTVQLRFDLPPGATVTSDGGFFQAGPGAATPEPASLMLAGTGVLGLAGYGFVRRKK